MKSSNMDGKSKKKKTKRKSKMKKVENSNADLIKLPPIEKESSNENELKEKKPNGKEDISFNIQNDTTKCESSLKEKRKVRNKNRSHINKNVINPIKKEFKS